MLDRSLQRDILNALRDCYPESAFVFDLIQADSDEIIKNLLYLGEHGLVHDGLSRSLSGSFGASPSRITAAGLDFLEEDGGLSAILRTITIKLHSDVVRSLIAAKIEGSQVPEIEKSTLRAHLASLSGKALEAGSLDLIQTGLRHIPDAAQWLRTLVGV